MSGEFQADAVKVVPIVVADADVATDQDIPILGSIPGANEVLRLRAVGVTAAVLPTAANAAVTFRDASADTETTLQAATDIVTGATASEVASLWRGDQVLDPGDTARVTLTGVTAGSVEGLCFLAEYVVEKHS